MATTVDVRPFVGTWRLVAWAMHDVQGPPSYPLGPAARGYLLYTRDGYMSATLMAPDRRPFAGGDLLHGDTAEQAAAAATYLSYVGRYEVHEHTVVHYVEVSLFPNWVGSRQERFYTFSGGQLTLSTAPVLVQGSTRRAVLIWERAVPR